MRSHALFSLGVFLAGAMAYAVDLDVEGAKRAYENQQAIADQAASVYRSEESAFQRENGNYLSEVSREKRYQQVINDTQSEISNLDRQITYLQNEIPQIEQRIRDLERDRVTLDGRLNQLQQNRHREQGEIRRLEMGVRRAEQELAAEKAKTPPDEARIAALQAEVDRARRELQSQEQVVQRLDSDIRNTQNRIHNIDSDISSCQTTLSQKRSQLAQYHRARQDRVVDLQNARDDLRQQQDNVRLAYHRMEDARRDMNNAKNDYDRQALLAQQAYQYYQTVLANYHRERERVIANAKNQANQDGAAEGAARAPADGDQVGADTASRVGLEVGTSEGRTRETRSGYRTGRADGKKDANSYQAGEAEGRALAERKATAEDKPRGYNDALAKTLASVPAAESTVEVSEGEVPPASGADGGAFLVATPRNAGSIAAPGFAIPADPAYRLPTAPSVSFSVPPADRRRYNPQCAGLALPEFEPLCQKSYEGAYRAAYDAEYRRSFQRAYGEGFDANIKAAYDAALTKSYPAEFAAGLTAGAKDQGILDGFASRLPGARQDQYASGAADWNAYLATGHLIRVKESVLNESSGDKLHTPGEKTVLVTTLDNLGKKPAPAAALRAVLQSRQGIEVKATDQSLPELAADTRTIVKGTMHGKLLPSRAGAQAGLVAQLKAGTSAVGALEAKATIHFPVEAEALTLAKIPQVDEEVDGVLRLRNRLEEKSLPSPLKAYTTPVVATVTSAVAGTPLAVPELQAGESIDLPVKVKPGVWVGKSTDVPLVIETENLGGIQGTITQQFPQRIDVDRAGSLLLYDWSGKPVPEATFNVPAGGRLQFQVLFQFHRTVRVRGPFAIRATGTSDPAIRHSNNSTIGTTYGEATPGTKYSPMALSYDIPASMKGKSGYVMVGLSEGGKYIHMVQVFVNVQ